MWYLVLAAALIVADQAVKSIVQSHLTLLQSVPVIEGVFHLTYIQNTGAAFSILEGQKVLFILLTSLVSLLILGYVIKNRRSGSRWLLIPLTSVAAGGIGNLIDRIRLGYVVDYLDFRIWPIFNIADMAVTVGCGFLIIYFFVIEPKNKKKNL